MTSGSSVPRPARILDPEHRRLTVGVVATVVFIAFEAIAVATAMPRAVADLNGVSEYSLAFSAFLTTSLVGMVVAGRAADERGPRSPLLAGVVLLEIGLLAAGAAQQMWPFVAARAVQGFGGGLVIVALYVVVGRSYAAQLRPRIFAAMSAGWVVPSIVGPVVAGLVADHLTWRLVFLGVAPLVLIPALLTLPVVWAMPAPEETDVRAARRGSTGLAVLTALGMAALQYAGTNPSAGTAVLALVGIALVVPSLPQLLPPGTLRLRRGLPTVVAMRGILAGAFFGAEAFLPLMLITERGVSSTLAGLSLTGGALGWASGSAYQGRTNLQRPRHLLVRTGCLLLGGGIAGFGVVLLPAVPFWVATVTWTIGAVGMGMGISSISVLLFQLSRPGEQGINSSAMQLSDAVGSIVFIGLAGTIFGAGHGSPGAVAADEAVNIPAWVFAGILAVMAGLAIFGAWAAGRIPVRDTAASPKRGTAEA